MANLIRVNKVIGLTSVTCNLKETPIKVKLLDLDCFGPIGEHPGDKTKLVCQRPGVNLELDFYSVFFVNLFVNQMENLKGDVRNNHFLTDYSWAKTINDVVYSIEYDGNKLSCSSSAFGSEETYKHTVFDMLHEPCRVGAILRFIEYPDIEHFQFLHGEKVKQDEALSDLKRSKKKSWIERIVS